MDNVEFYCKPCKEDQCILCKEKQINDIDSRGNDKVINRLMYGDFISEFCERHQDKYLDSWCMSCEFPVCTECEHRNHEYFDIFSAYKGCRHQNEYRILQIRNEIIFNTHGILIGIKSDGRTVKNICQHDLKQSMTIKASKLKHQADLVVNDTNELEQFTLSRLQKVKRKITNKEIFLYKLEQLLDKPLQFLLYLKKTPIPKKNYNPITYSFSLLNSEINIEDVTKLLVKIHIKETIKRRAKNEQLQELICTPVLQKSFALIGAILVRHISCVTTDMAWISDPFGHIVLTNTITGDPLHIVKNAVSCTGGHSVTREGDLIYIDRFHNIHKLSIHNKTLNTLIKKKEPWKADCIYCSHLNADLLVGVIRYDNENIDTEAKVIRYNSTGQQVQTIEHDSTDQKLYNLPKYITENHSGDVIASDLNKGVVVTDRTGRHRFSYTGPPSGSGLSPLGVCVDALSHILVSDAKSKTIQMIDKDGHFLSLLNKINVSGGLAYDNKNHLLLVGTTDYNRVRVYRYIARKENLKDDNHDQLTK